MQDSMTQETIIPRGSKAVDAYAPTLCAAAQADLELARQALDIVATRSRVADLLQLAQRIGPPADPWVQHVWALASDLHYTTLDARRRASVDW